MIVFATQEILVVLVPGAGTTALDYLVPISLVVIVLFGDRYGELSPDALCLPERRRLVHRELREPRYRRRADGSGIADGRLHAHRIRIDCGRRGCDHFGCRSATRPRRSCSAWGCSASVGRVPSPGRHDTMNSPRSAMGEGCSGSPCQ